MDNETKQQLSCLIDDELKDDEALTLLKKIQLQPLLNEKMNHYQAISYALSSKNYISLNPDFLKNVQQGMATEALYLLPEPRASQTIMALAACVALVTVLIFGITYQPMPSSTLAKLKASAYINPKNTFEAPLKLPQKINYLQVNHKSSHLPRYTQTASYQPNKLMNPN